MSSDPLSAPGVSPGARIAGKYQIDQVLGAGGMGVVVAARHVALDEKVAIKFLLTGALSNREAVERFTREARAAAKIQSDHVVRVSDVGTLEDGAPYMVMEYLEGRDLAAWIKQSGPLPVEQAVEYLLQACEAIAEAHALGIIHRDLKPANLFLARRRDGSVTVKVLDFGISKIVAGEGEHFTRTAAVMGSPFYMSPEQMRASREVDPRSDIWSLGVILYELVSGSLPFNAEAMPELILKIATERYEPLAAKCKGLPEGLELLVDRCLQKDREARYSSVAAFAAGLAPFGTPRSRLSLERISGVFREAGIPTEAALVRQPGLPQAPSSAAPAHLDASAAGAVTPAVGTEAPWSRTAARPTPKDSRAGWLAVGGVVVLIASGAGALRLQRSGEVSPAASASLIGTSPPIAPTAIAGIAPSSSEIPVPALSVSTVPTPAPSTPASGAARTPSAARTVSGKSKPELAAEPRAVAVPSAAAAPRPTAGWGGRL